MEKEVKEMFVKNLDFISGNANASLKVEDKINSALKLTELEILAKQTDNLEILAHKRFV